MKKILAFLLILTLAAGCWLIGNLFWLAGGDPAAAAGRQAPAVVSGEPVAGAAAQETGRVRRQRRRHAPGPVA